MKAILTVGVPASGKSTWAEQFVARQENPGQWHDMGLKVLRVGNPYIEF